MTIWEVAGKSLEGEVRRTWRSNWMEVNRVRKKTRGVDPVAICTPDPFYVLKFPHLFPPQTHTIKSGNIYLRRLKGLFGNKHK